ncbi:hypothetical protein [Heyndrickxia acidiproducens]|uniref:hypothetical protein n=1 Tax=Heyndrickxia acidiproducens TaxID=1121084 RepID=UPI000374BEFF|nr:hypothetical protein [Heyndrickxia acidiproducens]
MAFGISRTQLKAWKDAIDRGEIAFLTHFWLDDRFPEAKSVTKVGCNDLGRLAGWGARYELRKEWIHIRKDGYSHFDLFGNKQREVLEKEGQLSFVPHKFLQ